MDGQSHAAIWRHTLKIVEDRLRQFYNPHGYHIRHFWVLQCIREHEVVQGECAENLGINENVMVRIADQMEERGLLTRRRNPENRRKVYLRITKRGLEATDWYDRVHNRAMVQAYKPLTISEVEAITKQLRRIIHPSE